MTEDQIEREVERRMDALDARLMRGAISQHDYDREVHLLNRWAWIQLERRQDAIEAKKEAPTFATELTPAGEQSVIPGCERNASPRGPACGLVLPCAAARIGRA